MNPRGFPEQPKSIFANALTQDYNYTIVSKLDDPEIMKEPKAPVLQAGVVLAVAAAAASLVAGLGAYLFIRFTQHRREPPGTKKQGEP